MAYASNTDIQNAFGEDKIEVTDALAAKAKIESDRLIRGQLASVFTPLVLFSWTSPGLTPEIIRSISGRLCAAFIYRSIYSEEKVQVPQYAQELYNEAMADLQGIKNGSIVVIGADQAI